MWEGKLLSTVMKMRTLTSSIRVAESSGELHSFLQEFKRSLRTSRLALALDVPVGRCRFCL